MGTGGLAIGERVDLDTLRPLKQGGTGSRSGSEEQPEFLPDKFESGTLNVVGLAGLEAGIRWVLERGVETIQAHHHDLLRLALEGLAGIPGVTVHGTRNPSRQVPCIGLTIAGLSPSDAGLRLDEEFDIQTRVGLHCAPAAHQTLGTYPTGTIRLAPGILTSKEDMRYAVESIRALVRRGA